MHLVLQDVLWKVAETKCVPVYLSLCLSVSVIQI